MELMELKEKTTLSREEAAARLTQSLTSLHRTMMS